MPKVKKWAKKPLHQPWPLHETCTNLLRNIASTNAKRKVEAMSREREVCQVKKPLKVSTHIDVNMAANFDASILYFRINKKIQMRKLMQSYAIKKSMDFRQLKFYCNGHELWHQRHTPEDYGLRDNVKIDVRIRGARPYKCRHCENFFAQRDQLQAHVRIHPAEKPTTQINVIMRSFFAVYHLSLKKQSPVRKLMQAFSDRVGTPMENMRYTWDGNSLWDTDTPEEIGMLDGATIEVSLIQRGS